MFPSNRSVRERLAKAIAAVIKQGSHQARVRALSMQDFEDHVGHSTIDQADRYNAHGRETAGVLSMITSCGKKPHTHVVRVDADEVS
jgi:hypothetical protein